MAELFLPITQGCHFHKMDIRSAKHIHSDNDLPGLIPSPLILRVLPFPPITIEANEHRATRERDLFCDEVQAREADTLLLPAAIFVRLRWLPFRD